MSDTVFAALIGAAATLIVAAVAAAALIYQLREARREAEVAQRNEAAVHLNRVADTISGMRKQLAEEHIPRTLGHYFIGLLDGYQGKLQPYLGDKTLHELDELKRLVEEPAKIIDNTLYEGRKPEPEDLSKVLADMERVVGDVQAQAANISPTKSLRQ